MGFEEDLTGSISNQLSVASITLIAWATLITLAIVILVSVIFRRLRRGRGNSGRSNHAGWPTTASVTSDAESGIANDAMSDRASVIDFEPEDDDAAANASYDHRDLDVEKINGLFEDDHPTAEVHATNANLASVSSKQPNFSKAITRDIGGHGSARIRGLFLPDSGSSTF